MDTESDSHSVEVNVKTVVKYYAFLRWFDAAYHEGWGDQAHRPAVGCST